MMGLELNFLFVWVFISILLSSNLAKLTTFALCIQCHHISIYPHPSKRRTIILFRYFPGGPSPFWACSLELQVGRWVLGQEFNIFICTQREGGGNTVCSTAGWCECYQHQCYCWQDRRCHNEELACANQRGFLTVLGTAQFSNNIIYNVRDNCKRRCHGRTRTVLCYQHSYLWSP